VKNLTKFLLMSMQDRLKLRSDQIEMISPGLSHEQILTEIEKANWNLFRLEKENGIRVYWIMERALEDFEIDSEAEYVWLIGDLQLKLMEKHSLYLREKQQAI
jgi:hypothetical protein